MSNSAFKISQALQRIAQRLDDGIREIAGERIAFTLVIYTEGEAQYVSSASREDSIKNLKTLIERWESGDPDVPFHQKN
jgi:hypothetical protein